MTHWEPRKTGVKKLIHLGSPSLDLIIICHIGHAARFCLHTTIAHSLYYLKRLTIGTMSNVTDEDFIRSLPYKVAVVSIFSVLFVVGFCGNILVIYVVFKSPKMRTLTNFYLVSLAVSDCLVLVSATLTAIPEQFYYKEQWLYGPVMCSVFVFLQYLGINASALSITAFTIERYIGICHPMKAQTICTTRRAKCIISGLWIFSILYNACWLYLAHCETERLTDEIVIPKCTFRISRDQYSSIYMVDLILFYVIPLIITCVLYTLIGVTLWKSTRAMKVPIVKDTDFKPTIQRLIADRSINKDFRQSVMGNRLDLLKRMEAARLQVRVHHGITGS